MILVFLLGTGNVYVPASSCRLEEVHVWNIRMQIVCARVHVKSLTLSVYCQVGDLYFDHVFRSNPVGHKCKGGLNTTHFFNLSNQL